MEVKAKKILIIDDDSRNIFALKAVLKAKKFTCLSASSAQHGFDILASDKDVAVVLMDMMMPDMDGYQAISEMKKHPEMKSVPVIAVTAQAMVGDRERCINAGAVGYISKPVNVDELVLKLNNYI
jgi:two-component system cell cycle response regulator DivK